MRGYAYVDPKSPTDIAFPLSPSSHPAVRAPAGWFGPTCEVCTTDTACGILLKDPDGICRNTTFTAIREANGWCEISSEDVSNLIHGTGFVQIYYAANGTFFFDFIKRRGAGDFISLFRCNSVKTQVTEDPKLGQVKYASPDLVCSMTCEIGSDRTCTNGLANIVKNVGNKGGSTIVCDPAKRTCDVHENTLDTFLGGVQTSGCYMSECALKGETVSVSVGSFSNIAKQPPAQQTAYLLGMLMLVATFGLIAISGGYYARSAKYTTYEATAQLLGQGKGSEAAEEAALAKALGETNADDAAASFMVTTATSVTGGTANGNGGSGSGGGGGDSAAGGIGISTPAALAGAGAAAAAVGAGLAAAAAASTGASGVGGR